MIRRQDIDRILSRQEGLGEGFDKWCRRNDIDEEALKCVVEAYARDRKGAVAAICAFRVGYESRLEDEPRGELSSLDSRYVVQGVVVDTTTGRIIGSPSTDQEQLEALAATYNELEQEPSG